MMRKTILAIACTFSLSVLAQKDAYLIVIDADGVKSTVKATTANPELEARQLEAETGSKVYVDVPVHTPNMKDVLTSRSRTNYTSSMTKEQGKSSDYKPNDTFFRNQDQWGEFSPEEPLNTNVLNSIIRHTPMRKAVIGVLDSGFWGHPDLPYIDGYDFARGGDGRGERYFMAEQYDVDSASRNECTVHGTGVASIAAATRDNNLGIAGVSDAELIAVKVMECGAGWMNDAATGLNWLISNSADSDLEGIRPVAKKPDVVNVSMGTQASTCYTPLQEAITAANNAGTIVVGSVGNYNTDTSESSLSNCEGVVVVAPVSEDGQLYETSNYGHNIDIATAGTHVVGLTGAPDGYGWYSESSFSAPTVTGVIANAITEFGTFDIKELEFFMQATSHAFPAPECADSNICGIGILDADSFHEAIGEYSNDEQLVFTPALNNTQFCDKSLYATDNDELVRLCAIVEVKFPEIADDQVDVYYEIFSFPKGADKYFVNGTSIATTSASQIRLADVDTESFDYGVRVCTPERCFGDEAIAVKDNTGDVPEACK